MKPPNNFRSQKTPKQAKILQATKSQKLKLFKKFCKKFQKSPFSFNFTQTSANSSFLKKIYILTNFHLYFLSKILDHYHSKTFA